MMTSPQPSKDLSRDPIVVGLNQLLSDHSDQRVVVVGTTCTGKSTMLPFVKQAVDQDEEVFPKLTKEEADFVCQSPWTEEIGRTMIRLVRERVEVKPGFPVFGTVVIDCDHIVLLKISDQLLLKRTNERKTHFSDAKNMQKQLEEEVRSSRISWTEYSVG